MLPFTKTGMCPEDLVDAADSPAMMVRTAAVQPCILTEILPGKVVDGCILAAGDYVLLTVPLSTCVDSNTLATQQSIAADNGVWVVGPTAPDLKRPVKYLNAPGRQYYVTAGDTQKGTLYLCTAIGAAQEIKPITSRPALRNTAEEQEYIKALVQSDGGIRATRLSGPTTASDDRVTKDYIQSLRLQACTLRPNPASNQEDLVNKAYISSLGVTAGSLSGSVVTDQDASRLYIDALGINAKRAALLSGQTAADDASNKQYIESLTPAATLLFGRTQSDDTANRDYIGSLGVSAGRLTSSDVNDRDASRVHINSLQVDALMAQRLGGQTEDDRLHNQSYISNLELEVDSAKRMKLDTTAMTGPTNQAYISENGQYVREVLGVGSFCRRKS
jgi:hypothetical protein